MPLEMRKTSKWWYGRYNSGGKVHCLNLRIEIDGARPDSITQEGSKKFERSRGRAQEKFDTLVADAKEKRNSAEYVQKLHEIRTGRRIDSIHLPAMAQEWEELPRNRRVKDGYLKTAKYRFARFLAFMTEKFPAAETMADVIPEMAVAYMQYEENGACPRTWNGALALLKSAFRKLGHKGNVVLNPFDGIPAKRKDTVHRKPFSKDELKAILNAAQHDDFVRPLVVTGICTAMRRGDCCMLRWKDVDLQAKFVRVKTSKTGETVEIPMFPVLRDELERHLGNGSEFVFPEQAAMYREKEKEITDRVRVVFEAAGFYDSEEDEGGGKKDRPKCLGAVTEARGPGMRRVSVRDFHSFRVTWITLALAAGVPMELVTRVTGHQTVEVVLKHYFRPGREDFRKAIEGAMPRMLMEGAAPSASATGFRRDAAAEYQKPATPAAMIQTAIESLQRMTAQNWKEQREAALRSLRDAAIS